MKGCIIVEALTISDLERRTGVPRSTIHYYIAEELLPGPQKSASTRAFYSHEHVDLIERIGKLKCSGHSLAEIRFELQQRTQGQSNVDLVAQQYQETHQAILRAAAEEFAGRGYRNTSITTIVRRAGISRSALYTHFPSKRHLLVETFQALFRQSLEQTEPKVAQSPDMIERMLGRMGASFSIDRLSKDVLALLSAEMLTGPDATKSVARAFEELEDHIAGEIRGLRQPGSSPPPVSDELLAYSLQAAMKGAADRASWDDKFGPIDVVRVHTWLWLVVRSALRGEIDVGPELESYEALMQQTAATEPVRGMDSSGGQVAK
jgi:AcrR family transcriptional regulator